MIIRMHLLQVLHGSVKAEYSFTENEVKEVPIVRTKSIIATEHRIIIPFLFHNSVNGCYYVMLFYVSTPS